MPEVAPHAPDARLILAERSVPRYTSYPTAPHFSEAVDDALAARWLADLDARTPLSVYLHVPFCRELCHYCGCATKAVRRAEPVLQYLDGLLREMELVATATRARRVEHLHWGGGSPQTLGEAGLARALDGLDRSFSLSDLVEHAIELDPRTLPKGFVRRLARLGVDRASLGVQDFDPAVQAAIGRVQPIDVVRAAVDDLRAFGIGAINFDLMYGLPLQSVDGVVRSAETAAAMRPSRIALFGYAHVPWMRKHQTLIRTEDLPGPVERIAQEAAARRTLVAAGYVSIGLDHFALPEDSMAIAAAAGTLQRNFQGYTTDGAAALIGLGATSIGRLPQGYLQNAPDVAGWRRRIDEGRLAVVRGVAFTDEDRVRGGLIERLMCDLSVDLNAVASRIDIRPALTELSPLVDQGLVRIEGTRIGVTETGRPFIRLVANAFDGRRESAARHSLAV